VFFVFHSYPISFPLRCCYIPFSFLLQQFLLFLPFSFYFISPFSAPRFPLSLSYSAFLHLFFYPSDVSTYNCAFRLRKLHFTGSTTRRTNVRCLGTFKTRRDTCFWVLPTCSVLPLSHTAQRRHYRARVSTRESNSICAYELKGHPWRMRCRQRTRGGQLPGHPWRMRCRQRTRGGPVTRPSMYASVVDTEPVGTSYQASMYASVVDTQDQWGPVTRPSLKASVVDTEPVGTSYQAIHVCKCCRHTEPVGTSYQAIHVHMRCRHRTTGGQLPGHPCTHAL
jgi:hypothetical protein